MRKYSIVSIIILSGVLFLGVNSYAARQNSKVIYISAKSAIVIDARTDKILYAKNTGLHIPPASCAKVMTALVVLDNLDLDKMMTVSRKAENIEPSKAGLKAGVQYEARDLLAACLMSSSNDASIALAEAVAGSESAFVKLMNDKAKKIGMKNTCFVNATGLPIHLKKGPKKIEQYSTAYDLAQMIRYALNEPLIVELMNTKEKNIKGNNGIEIHLRNHNKMLWRRPKSIIGKTGYTVKSKHCFTGAANSNGRKIVFAILSSKKPWQDISILVNYGLYAKNS